MWKIKKSGTKSTLAYRFVLIFEKKLFLQPHINLKERYLSGILNCCPELKLYPVFKKIYKFQSQNLRIFDLEPAIFKISKIFVKATHYIFKFHRESVLFTFLLLWF
jgi:hypothetical protein